MKASMTHENTSSLKVQLQQIIAMRECLPIVMSPSDLRKVIRILSET